MTGSIDHTERMIAGFEDVSLTETVYVHWTERGSEQTGYGKIRIARTDERSIGRTSEDWTTECIDHILQTPNMVVMAMSGNDGNGIRTDIGTDAFYGGGGILTCACIDDYRTFAGYKIDIGIVRNRGRNLDDRHRWKDENEV